MPTRGAGLSLVLGLCLLTACSEGDKNRVQSLGPPDAPPSSVSPHDTETAPDDHATYTLIIDPAVGAEGAATPRAALSAFLEADETAVLQRRAPRAWVFAVRGGKVTRLATVGRYGRGWFVLSVQTV